MLRACVVGHSLVPSAILLNVPSVKLDIIRHPGATISSLTSRVNDIDFWSRRYVTTVLFCVLEVTTYLDN